MLSHILPCSSRSIQLQYVTQEPKKCLNQQYNDPATPGNRQYCEHANLYEQVYIKYYEIYVSNDASRINRYFGQEIAA